MSAACTEVGPDLFFPEFYRRSTTAQAVAICRRCPIIEDCLRMALEAEGGLGQRNRYGVFGGTTPEQREHLAKRLDRVGDEAA